MAGSHPVRVPITLLPVRVGRSQSAQLTVNHPSVSRVHCELVEKDGCVAIVDLNSKNGTFVNYQRITEPTVLHAGDFLHLGSCELRVLAENDTLEEYRLSDETWVIKEPGGAEFQRLLETRSVVSKFQPLVMLENSLTFAFEALGRGHFPGAPRRPDDLFRVAQRYGYSRALSSVFRMKALRTARDLPAYYLMFFNVHADELKDANQFISEMAQARDLYPHMSLVAEVPESAEMSTAKLQDVRSALRDLGYGIAYDDFGVGQARLVQLTDCPPDYLKFDRALIGGIDQASASRQKMVSALVDLAHDLGCTAVAEGVETLAEAQTAREMGFQCAQGYLFGRPMAPETAFAS